MRRSVAGSLVFLLAILPNCQARSPEAPLANLEVKKAYFGFKYNGQADNPGVQIVLSGSRGGCDSLDSAKETLSVSLSRAEVGEYTISGRGPEPSGLQPLSASASHRIDDFEYRLAAGTFFLTALDQDSASPTLEGKLHVYAPLEPLTTRECSGSDEGTVCTCEAEDGDASTCVPDREFEDCCPYQPVDHWELDFSIKAQFCKELCQASSPTLYAEVCRD